MLIKPELQSVNPLDMTVKDPRHYKSAGVAGFPGSYDHGGITQDMTPRKGQGASIIELGTKAGADAVLRDGSLGAAGLNRRDPSSFSQAMLAAIDKVSERDNRAQALVEQAIVDPGSVDAHDITIAQAEAGLSLNIARTILSRLTQAWRDIINTR